MGYDPHRYEVHGERYELTAERLFGGFVIAATAATLLLTPGQPSMNCWYPDTLEELKTNGVHLLHLTDHERYRVTQTRSQRADLPQTP